MLNAAYQTENKRQTEPETMSISLSGEADMLISDPNGKRIGYDSAKKDHGQRNSRRV